MQEHELNATKSHYESPHPGQCPDLDIESAFKVRRFSETELNQPFSAKDLPNSIVRIRDLHYALNQVAIVSITDLNGDIIYANENFIKVMKYDASEVIGKNHRIFNSGFHDRKFFKNLWDRLLAGQVWQGEVRDKAKDGSFVWLRSTIVPFIDDHGRSYQYVSLRTDITAEKNRAEARESERAHREYVARLSALGEIAANLAHEIRNPLASILLNTQSMARAAKEALPSSERLDRYLLTIERTAKRIERIIDNVQRLSRDGTHDRFERVDLCGLVEETLEFCKARFERGDVQLNVEFPKPGNLKLSCRAVQISQVLLNLLNNAFDAVQDLPERWVKLKIREDSENFVMEVMDSGSGVPKEIQEKIMSPYFTTKQAGKGTGLGLSISRKIIEEHRGQLQLISATGPTTFQVRIPRLRP